MSYICLDVWDKRVGVAVSSAGIAFPKQVVPRTEIISYLKKYFLGVSENLIIVVWLPYDLYGTDTKQLEKTQKFILKLQDIFPDKKIIWHDERFSSFAADEWFFGHSDDIAAQQILQSYLDSKK